MKATIRTWAILVGFACTLSASAASAQATGRLALELGLVTCSQAADEAPADPADPRAEAAMALKQARAAMRGGDLEGAEQYLLHAENLGVKFNLLQNFADTPKKVRRDLEKAKAAQGKKQALPSERFAPDQAPSGQQQPTAGDVAPVDPSLDQATTLMSDRRGTGRIVLAKAHESLAEGNIPAAVHYYRQLTAQGAALDVDAAAMEELANQIREAGGRIDNPVPAALDPSGRRAQMDPNELPTDEGHPLGPAAARPPAGQAPGVAVTDFPAESPFGGQPASNEPPVDPNEGLNLPGRFAPQQAPQLADARGESDRLVRAARLSLADGDVQRAATFVEQARALGVQYGYHDDQPEKVAAAIEQYRMLQSTRKEDRGTNAFRRQYAKLLMDQAVALIAWNELDRAQGLATDAERLRVDFGSFEVTPRKVLDQIKQVRAQAAGAAGGVQPAVAETPLGQPNGAGAAQAIYQPQADPTRNVPTMQSEPLYPDDAAPLGELPPVSAPTLSQPLRTPTAADATAEGGGEPTPDATDEFASPPVNEPLPDAVPTQQLPLATQPPAANQPPAAATLVEWGAKALSIGDLAQARAYLQEAQARRGELDPATAAKLDQFMHQLNPTPGEVSKVAQPGSLIPDASQEQKMLANKVATDLGRREAAARNLAENDPQQALAKLQEARQMVETAGLDSASRDILLRRVDRLIGELTQYIERNKPLVELKERNRSVEEEMAREMSVMLSSQQKLADLVEEFNTLVDEERFPEAIVVARRANEIMPGEPVVQQLMHQANFLHRYNVNLAVSDAKENGFIDALGSVDAASTPFDDRHPYQFPDDPKKWAELTASRKKITGRDGMRRSEKEIEIEQKLRTPVSLNFENVPLAEVVKTLSQIAQVNIFLDPQGLGLEGVTSDDPVTIVLAQDVQLRSALRLILEPKHLSYVIKDEVLKITSTQLKDTEMVTVDYGVADLVIPIPNFVPSSDMGMAGALRDAYNNVGFGNNGGLGGASPLMVAANRSGSNQAGVDAAVMAQLSPPIGGGNPAATGSPQSIGFGPGGAGGGAQADFDSLIELITSTIAPTTWDEVGGPGSIKPFDTNLSLVVSQTQEVHEQIVDLLEQLRRLQDLQVTIEVRFITLNDNFFERIGVDFDFDIDDDIDKKFAVFGKPLNPSQNNDDATATERDLADRDHGKSVTVGLSAPGVFSTDLDIPFTQNSFGLAVPQFGGFDASAGASLGFAILSDLEAFFFINAAQGDRRSNVLQAPKVTLFNGQAAFVSDTSQSPFVISVIPVVGDFAAAQQPVIVVLSEGTFLTVQAVISSDRRFVRLTVVPFFSQIGDVDTFTFSGSSTTTEESEQQGPDDDPTQESQSKTVITEGTTVQLPTFSFVTVTTTVSVPDGGTVLLGGIKRLSEGRNEFGVPMLNKLPYINRLFKNVGIGRETQSLMMMVTPRIIIQEEEEALLGIGPTP